MSWKKGKKIVFSPWVWSMRSAVKAPSQVLMARFSFPSPTHTPNTSSDAVSFSAPASSVLLTNHPPQHRQDLTTLSLPLTSRQRLTNLIIVPGPSFFVQQNPSLSIFRLNIKSHFSPTLHLTLCSSHNK